MSKRFTITITGECPDDTQDGLIYIAAGQAALEIDEGKFLSTNVRTDVAVAIVADEFNGRGPRFPNIPSSTAEQACGKVINANPGQKIHAIKDLRAEYDIGLKDAKFAIDYYWERFQI